MKTKLVIFMLIITAAVANAADKPIDITGADATTFKAHVGRVISLGKTFGDVRAERA